MWGVEGVDEFYCFPLVNVECFVVESEEAGSYGSGGCLAILNDDLFVFLEVCMKVDHKVGKSLKNHPLSFHGLGVIESRSHDLMPVCP